MSDYLKKYDIPGIQGVDTRALTKKLRVAGAMKGFISTEGISEKDAVQKARDWHGMEGMDYVKDVTHKEPFLWDEKDTMSPEWDVVTGNEPADYRNIRKPLRAADIPIVAYDFGAKYNIRFQGTGRARIHHRRRSQKI